MRAIVKKHIILLDGKTGPYMVSTPGNSYAVIRLQSVSIVSSLPPRAEVKCSRFMCIKLNTGNISVTLEVKVREQHQNLGQSAQLLDLTFLRDAC